MSATRTAVILGSTGAVGTSQVERFSADPTTQVVALAAAGRTEAFMSAASPGVVSLFFRTIDAAVCGAFPTGTHFLWHLMNGAMLWWMIRVLVRSAPAR